ncbi:MAG: bifunctional metallophosphatase/5'-nucleotidase [Bacteroidales bacterium]
MIRKLALFACLLLAFQTLAGQRLTILHTNDLHSRLWGFGPEADYTPLTINDDQTIGGFARIAAVISEYRNKQAESLLVLDAGDFLMGTIFHTAEAKTGFQLRLMKKMGYDFVSIGNHEFDFGVKEMAKILSKSAEEPIPGLILSNISFDSTDTADNNLETLFSSGVIKPYRILVRNGLKIGFFALMGVNAASVTPYVKPAKFTDRILSAKYFTRMLKDEEKVDLVICLSHSGLVFDPKKGWQGDDVELAQQVPGIDVIISGHTHTSLAKPLIVNNIPIVQAGSEGRYVGKLEIEKTIDGVKALSGELIPVDDQIPGDPKIQRLIEEQQKLIGTDLFSEYGCKIDKPVIETSFDVRFNQDNNLETSTLGPFLADALYDYARQVDRNPTDVALVTAGLTRDEIQKGKTGKQMPADLFRILPLGFGVTDESFGYSMSKIYVTGRELKNILEVMLLAKNRSSDYYGYWSGVRYKINPLRLPLDRVYQIELGNEKEGYRKIKLNKDKSKLYGIVSNAYVMEFFGIIKSMTKGILKVVPKFADGTPIPDFKLALIDRDPNLPGIQEAKEWAGLLTYASKLPDLNGNGIPDMSEKYREVQRSSETKASINPVLCFKGTNGINVVPAVLVAAILAGVALIIF